MRITFHSESGRKTQSRILLSIISAFLVLGTAVSAQSEGSDWTRDTRIELIRSKATTGSEVFKLEAIEWIDEMITDGSYSDDLDEILEILTYLGTEPYTQPMRTGISPELLNDHRDVRKAAAITLGGLEETGAVNVLLSMLYYEEDPDVLKDIMYSLGNLGMNPNDRSTTGISHKITRLNAVDNIDNELAYATVYALGSIADKNGGIDDPEIYPTLLTLYDDKFSAQVKQAAADLYRKLFGG